MEITRELMVHAVIGKGFKNDYVDEEKMVKLGLAKFTGNQWNENWEFDRNALFQLNLESLKSLYYRF